MKVLITGAKGQLGCDLIKALDFPSCTLYPFSREELDITNDSQVRALVRETKPDIIINAAAYTKVDLCEENRDLAFKVNSLGVYNLVKVCKEFHIDLVHFSTDYVFDGTKSSPYKETDTIQPLNAYGISKVAGEYIIQAHLENYFIIRTSGLFGGSPTQHSNFVTRMIGLSQKNMELRIVNDQILSPTYGPSLASSLTPLIESKKYGTYHITNQGSCTWYDFACEIFKILNNKITIIPISSTERVAPAKRPKYSVLSNEKAKKMGILPPPHWKDALKIYLNSL